MCLFKNIFVLLIYIGGIVAEIAWLGFCFGTIIIGIALLILAPNILFAPMVIAMGIAEGVNQGC